MIANSTTAGFWNPIANTAANQAINTMRDFLLKRLSAGGRKYDDVTQVSKPAVSPTSSRQTVLCSGACGFGNPRDSRFGNLRYVDFGYHSRKRTSMPGVSFTRVLNFWRSLPR